MTTDADIADLESRLAVIADEHGRRSELDGRRRTRAALRKWGEPIPEPLAEAHDLAAIVNDWRDWWLATVEADVGSLDYVSLERHRAAFHAIDAGQIDATAPGMGAFTAADLFDLLPARLLRCRRPGPVAVLDVTATADRFAHVIASHGERVFGQSVRIAMVAAALHEFAHAVEMHGQRLPPGTDLDDMVRTIRTAPPVIHGLAFHPPRWLRAYAHLAHRSRGLPPSGFYVGAFAQDVETYLPGPGADWIQALGDELRLSGPETPLVDILAAPPPSPFVSLVAARYPGGFR
jgi:hypothetical protein